MQETYAISMDAKAIQQAVVYKKNNPQWQELSLRLYLAGKGCDGFIYGVSFDDAHDVDTHFTFASAEGESIDLVVDPETLKFVQTSSITWVDDERGKGFLVENPRHKKFRGKFFKRAGWEERLLETQEG